jgi:hypothetical protein
LKKLEPSKTIVCFPENNTVRCVTEAGKEASVIPNIDYDLYHLPKVGSQTNWCRLYDRTNEEEIHVEERLILKQGKFVTRARFERLFVVDPEMKLHRDWPDLLKEVSKDIPAEVTDINTKFYVNRMVTALQESMKKDFGIEPKDLSQTFIDIAKLELSDIDRRAVLKAQMHTYELDSKDRLHVFVGLTTVADVIYDNSAAKIYRVTDPTKESASERLRQAMIRALDQSEP